MIESEFHILSNAYVRLDLDPLPVQRARWLMTRRLAADGGRPPLGDPLLKFRPSNLSRRDNECAPEAVYQKFGSSADAGQDARKARDGRDSLLASQQCGVRAMSERLHDHGR